MILVTGATGNNGRHVVRQLMTYEQPIRVLVRDSESKMEEVSALTALGVEIVAGDLAKPASILTALKGVDSAFLLSSVDPNQVSLQSNFIHSAKTTGVCHVVKFSMIGAAEHSPVPLSQWHWESEQELNNSGLAWTILSAPTI